MGDRRRGGPEGAVEICGGYASDKRSAANICSISGRPPYFSEKGRQASPRHTKTPIAWQGPREGASGNRGAVSETARLIGPLRPDRSSGRKARDRAHSFLARGFQLLRNAPSAPRRDPPKAVFGAALTSAAGFRRGWTYRPRSEGARQGIRRPCRPGCRWRRPIP
jgi:hypothetical protein